MAACAYRSLAPVLHERLALLEQQRQLDAPVVDVLRGVAARRVARGWGGTAALALAVIAFGVALLSLPSSYPAEKALQAWATILLFGAPLAGLAVALVARIVARAWLAAKLDAPPSLSGDPASDLARIDAAAPVRSSLREAMRWERASVALPLAAVSMLAPLSIHGVVWCALSAPSGLTEHTIADFGAWIGMSALLVGHAHLAVLVGSVRWAMRLPGVATQDLQRGLHKQWGTTLLVAVGVSCLPGIALFGIPPVLVTVTGLAFLPAAFAVAARAVSRERMALDAI